MPTIDDKEFGSIAIRRNALSRSMKVSVAPNGLLRVSAPTYAPIFMIRRMIQTSRPALRKLLTARPQLILQDGMSIGKSHQLVTRQGSKLAVKRTGRQLIVTLADGQSLIDSQIVGEVRKHILTILRVEAKAHLPKRLSYLATKYKFEYTTLRFTHASSRWGSCNQKKAISLNIALMNLPFELIDYVLLHELAHTVELNHSDDFWKEVARCDPEFKIHRKILKSHDPTI